MFYQEVRPESFVYDLHFNTQASALMHFPWSPISGVKGTEEVGLNGWIQRMNY